MNIGQVIILGLVQGVAEWWPISSDGHLVIAEHFLALDPGLAFDVFLHLASLLVLLMFFRRQILDILQSFVKQNQSSERRHWAWYLLLSTGITAAIGFYFYDRLESWRNLDFVSLMLMTTSPILLLTKWAQGQKTLTWRHAIFLGAVQGLAVLPGLSRSALVISSALILGIRKKDAFEYGFLMAIPAIAGAFILSAKDLVWQNIYLLGFVVTLVSGYLALRFLQRLIDRDYFYWFFVYSLLLGIILKLL